MRSGSCSSSGRGAVPVEIVSGERIGSFLVLVDQDGVRHAVKPGAVLCVSDADQGRDATVLQLPGGRVLLVPQPMDEVLDLMGALGR